MLRPLKIAYNSQTDDTVLTGLRGLAILMVLLYHCYPSLYKVGTGIGWIGVDFMFVLTGFVVTDFLIEAKNKSSRYLQNSFLHQLSKTLTPYTLVLIIFFLLVPLIAGSIWMNQYDFLYKNQIWYWLCIPNWWVTFLNHWPGTEPNLNPNLDLRVLDHLWLPAAEIQFCLILLILILLFKERILIFVFLYLFIQSVVIRNIFMNQGLHYAVSYVFTFGRLDAPMAGALAAVLIKNENSRKLLEKTAIFILLTSILGVAGIIVLTKSLTLMNPYFIRIGYTLIAVMFVSILLYTLSEKNFLRKIIQTKFFQWLGRQSYNLYAYHWILYLLLFPVFNIQLEAIDNLMLRGFIISNLCIIVILAISFISWHLLEKRLITLKGKADFGKETLTS